MANNDNVTPHIEAKKEEIAPIVLMPGDPMRAKYIAENYLEDAKLVNKVRAMYAYTGTYKGKKITVMSSGMGIASIGIYSYELYHDYDVESIIRIGSMWSYDESLNIYDLILVNEAYSESTYAKIQNGEVVDILSANNELNGKIKTIAQKLNIPLQEGRIHSSDVFYHNNDFREVAAEKQCLGVEMESFGLFQNAKVLNKKAACILTVSDSFVTKQVTSSEEREKNLKQMIFLALETTLEL